MDRRRFLQSLLLIPILKLNLPEHSAAEDIPDDRSAESAVERTDSSFNWMTTARHGSVSCCASPGWLVSSPNMAFEKDDIVDVHTGGGTVAIRYGDMDTCS